MIKIEGTFTNNSFNADFIDSTAIAEDRVIDKEIVKQVLLNNIDQLLNEIRSEIIAAIGDLKGLTKPIKPSHNSLKYCMEMSVLTSYDYYGCDAGSEINFRVNVVPVKVK